MSNLGIGNITSSNSSTVLTVESVFPQGVIFQSYSTDAAWALDEVQLAQGDVGVDGVYTAGYTPMKKVITFTFNASSPTVPSLEAVATAMDTAQTIFGMSLILTIPSIGKVYTFTEGTMVSGKRLADGAKVLNAQTFKFEFGKVKASSV